jgi:uncharacterized protein (UPF0332 family)
MGMSMFYAAEAIKLINSKTMRMSMFYAAEAIMLINNRRIFQ